MKRLLFVFMIFGWITFLADAQEVRSPDENVRAVFEVKDSIPYYSIFYKNREIISSCRLGLDLITDEFEEQGIKIAADRYSLKDGFEFSKIENYEFDETWEPVWGENSEILNHYQEMEVDLYQQQADSHIIIRIRGINERGGIRT